MHSRSKGAAGAYIHGTSHKEQGRLSRLNDLTNRSFIGYLGVQPRWKVCEFGSGLACLIASLSRLQKNAVFTGVEISEERHRQAKITNRYHTNVTLFNRDVFDNQLPDNAFDLTYCRYLLEHVADPVGAVREMIRVTKPGGKIVTQENDLRNVIFFPDVSGYDQVQQCLCDLQQSMGGDPTIGRKLFLIFKQAGAADIHLDSASEIHHEDEPAGYKAWLQNSLDILAGAKAGMRKMAGFNETEFNLVCSQFKARIRRPRGVALFHWDRVTAYKPYPSSE